MNVYYKLEHKYKLDKHIEKKHVGIFSSKEKAEDALKILSEKVGFIEHQDGFYVKKIYRVYRYKLLNNIYWDEGFDTYNY